MKRVLPSEGLRGPQYYWQVMVALSAEGGFTITDVHQRTNGRSRRTIKAYVLFCAGHGHIAAVGEQILGNHQVATVYKVREPRAAAPVERRSSFAGSHGRGRQQIWTAMRALKLFTVRELAVSATTSDHAVSEKTARSYVGLLVRAGYVAEVGRRTRSGEQARWKLLPAFNTGPLAPAALGRESVLYDRNLARAVNLNGSSAVGRAA